MDLSDDDSTESSSTRDEKLEENVHDLLEEAWFFGKFLNAKPRMLRCYSDPSSSFSQEILSKAPPNQESSSSSTGRLWRTPSLPPSIGRGEDKIHHHQEEVKKTKLLDRQLSADQTLVRKLRKESCRGKKENHGSRRSKLIVNGEQPRRPNLLRTPSLPPNLGREEEVQENEEEEITMSRLIRQAMPTASDFLSPQRRSKSMIQNSSMPKNRPPRSPELEIAFVFRPNDAENPNRYSNHRSLKKSLSNLEFQDAFKELEFKPDKKDLNPSAVDIQENKRDRQNQNKVNQAYMPEPWHRKSCAAPIPIRAGKNSAQDMKAQLKFWARAVASNVR